MISYIIKILLLSLGMAAVNSNGRIDKCSLAVEIIGLRNSKGAVLISLYNNKDAFPEDANKAVRNEKVTIVNGRAKINFQNIACGTYAIAVLHDENNNVKMDFNIVGMPKEGYGFSKDAQGTFGPPSFEKASLKVNAGNAKTVIKIRYFL